MTQFFQVECPSCHPTNSVKALKARALKAIPETLPEFSKGGDCHYMWHQSSPHACAVLAILETFIPLSGLINPQFAKDIV